MNDPELLTELAQAAARAIVEDGLDYAEARHAALAEAGLAREARWQQRLTNELVEDEVRTHIALFCADTQAGELRALRELAARWMHRLAAFRPHVGGAVWRGTATRLSSVRLDLYADDSKSPEIALLNLGLDFDTASLDQGRREPSLVYTLTDTHPGLDEPATLHLQVLGVDDLRGALKPDARGRTWRGDLAALTSLLQEEDAA